MIADTEVKRPSSEIASGRMKALVYHGPGKRAWEDRPHPVIEEATDAIVRITTSTICGTDLHILKGDVPSVTDGRILGHEGIGIVESAGSAVAKRVAPIVIAVVALLTLRVLRKRRKRRQARTNA